MTQVSLIQASNRESAPSLVRPVFKAVGLLAVSLMISGAPAFAKNGGGGTAKPPKPGTTVPTSTVPVTVPSPPAIPTQTFPNIAVTAGFGATGFVQAATLDATGCPSAAQAGGTVIVNGRKIIVPCNTIVQFPANTLAWSELFTTAGGAPLGLDGSVGTATAAFAYPSTEISVTGNTVAGRSIAGLITFSQQSLNNGAGYITRIDYATGTIYVGDAVGGADQAKLVINDPNGRFGRAQSPDARFSVDDENPTIIANSGFPMCVPRFDPASQDDPKCPKKNRPTVGSAFGCRNFRTAGVVSPAGWELAAPTGGATSFCSAFVMPAVASVTAATPDPRQQAPFQVGDYIEYSGTLLRTSGPVTADTISVHTIHANVGIFTQPGTLPVYLSIEESIIGTDAVPIAGQAPELPALEGQDRFVIVGTTTDVTTPVDVYLIDVDPVTGEESNRWITPESMTGGIAPGTPPFLGGIMTQLTGPQPGRFRLRANKPPAGILTSPTRNVRVVARTLCAPASATVAAAGTTPAATYYNINAAAPMAEGPANVTATCLTRDPVANGLFAGQYLAPVSEYIFPENVVAGDRPVPYNFWALGFLINGEGPGTGGLIPKPW